MNLLARLARFIAQNLFYAGLLLLPLLGSVTILLSTPSHVEQTVTRSGIYHSFIDAVLDQSAASATDQSAKSLLSDQGVRDAINRAFPAPLLQQSSEQAIGGIYDWLNGKTAVPQFTIDLSGPKQQLVNNLNLYGQQRATALPRCTLDQLKQLPSDQNILTIPCLPPGIDSAQAAQQFSTDVVKNANFLNNPVITAADLPKGATGKTLPQQYSTIPSYFSFIKALPWIVGSLVVLLAGTVMLLSIPRRAGISRIGWSLVSTGALLLVGVAFYILVLKNAGQHLDSVTSAAVRSAMGKAITSLANDYNRYVAYFAGAYVVAGSCLLFIAHRMKIATMSSPTAPAQPGSPVIATSAPEPITTNSDKQGGNTENENRNSGIR